MKSLPSIDNNANEPLRDDLFGHGSSLGDEKPPDVGRMWKDFNKKLNRLLRLRKKGEDPDRDDDPFNDRETRTTGLKIALAFIVCVGLFLWLGTGFYSVQEGQAGIVMTFGKVSKMASPGINYHVPPPFQRHEIVDVSGIQTIEIGYRNNVRNKKLFESLMVTSDDNIIDLQIGVQFKVKSPTDYAFNNANVNEVIKQVAESVVREIVGRNKMDYILYEGRDVISSQATQKVQVILDGYKAGVNVLSVALQGVAPPDKVLESFDDAVKAEQEGSASRNEGLAYANEVIPKAKGTAIRLREEAIAYKQEVIAQAEGDAARFRHIVAEYHRAPTVTRDRMYLETMQEIFKNTSKMMVDSKKSHQLLYLPLDKLIEKSDEKEKVATPEESNVVEEKAAAKKVAPQPSKTDRSRGGR